ncbi:unnamed protein product [Angiostrongylus costaricensis]|uniref:DUF1758 domain-containing protein n=1 Tax=Angiostrongylus costaricensis TaxID=334426 RepID=A0A0R3PF22_ANGCS|nr:unnamed protein product [Angiostrongylus costaricensis]
MESQLGKSSVPRNIRNNTSIFTGRDHKSSENTHKKPQSRFNCNKTRHLPIDCTTIKTQQEKVKVIKDRNLCYNCGCSVRRLPECKGGPCRNCNKHGHHTSICKYQHLPSEPKPLKEEKSPREKPKPHNLAKARRTILPTVNTVTSNETQGEHSVALHTIKQYESRVQIWASQATVLNPDKTKKELVEVLPDTVADRSFVTNDLAKTLQLKDAYSTELAIHKFEDSEADTKKYRITSIILRDIPLSIDPTCSTIHPKFLLGSRDVTKVLDKGLPLNNTLPSGLTLIPSRFGNLITRGTYKQQNEPDTDIVPTANTTQTFYEITESEENPWAFESPADNEFMGSNRQEPQQQNTAIWKQFQETIEKREDGYYVLLPWKNDVTTLLDNKAMAVKRLQAIITISCSKLPHWKSRKSSSEEGDTAETSASVVLYYLFLWK